MFVYMFHFCLSMQLLSCTCRLNVWMKRYLSACCCCCCCCCCMNPQWISFWACVAWETKFGRSSVEGLNLLDNKDAAASSASLWITALILPLQNKHVDVRKMKEPWTSSLQQPLCRADSITVVNVSKWSSCLWIYIQLRPRKVTCYILQTPPPFTFEGVSVHSSK